MKPIGSIGDSVDEEPLDLNDNSSTEAEDGKTRIKKRPGETKAQALARV